jgi:hypothetical protein
MGKWMQCDTKSVRKTERMIIGRRHARNAVFHLLHHDASSGLTADRDIKEALGIGP